MWGTVVGAWTMVRRACVEQDDVFSDADMASQKLSADFFVRNILPRAKGYAEQVTDGGTALLTMDEALF